MDEQIYIYGKITKINKNFFSFIAKNKKCGLVYINDISDYYIDDISTLFKVGEIMELLIKQYKQNVYYCSFKHGRADYLDFPFNYKIKETENKFNNLYKFNNKEVLKWKQ